PPLPHRPRIRLPHLRRTRPQPLTTPEQRFALGTRSLADLIAPGAMEVARGHVRLEHQYVRVLVVTGYPRTVGPGWLDPLLTFAEPLELSLHLNRLESAPMV